ncbi:MAG: ABC transporter permease, partial [Anaerolineaceae bacterium]|nr:ABC transporter permease [Anaerolineaceae bacterium]
SPFEQHLTDRLQSPSTNYLLGTDWAGRDTLSRLIFGSQITLKISFSTVFLSGICGISLGLLAGYFGGFTDTVITAFTNLIFSFPSLILALTISVLLGPSTSNMIVVLSILYTPNMIRMTRGATFSVKEQEYVIAARATGCSVFHIMLRHILPNLIAPVLVQLTIGFSWCILAEAALTYLGFGAQPPDASWGAILNEGRPTIWVSAWPSIFAGVFIGIAVLGFNFTGDGLRDILDPTQRHN